MTRIANTTATAVERNAAGEVTGQTVVRTFALGAWEQGALQVLLDAVSGAFDTDDVKVSQAFVDALLAASGPTTLGADAGAVGDSLDHLESLVRGFSQADEATITATVRDV